MQSVTDSMVYQQCVDGAKKKILESFLIKKEYRITEKKLCTSISRCFVVIMFDFQLSLALKSLKNKRKNLIGYSFQRTRIYVSLLAKLRNIERLLQVYSLNN